MCRRYTAAEDVNYVTHSERSSYRAESVTSRTSERGRSSSTEVVSVSGGLVAVAVAALDSSDGDV